MTEISCWRPLFRLPSSNLRMALIPEPLLQFGWITPYVAVFKYYAFEYLSCDSFADISIFFSISGKIRHVVTFNPFWCHIARFSKNRYEMFRIRRNRLWLIFVLIGLFLSKLSQPKKIYYLWIIVKKIYLRQREMNCNDAIIIWSFEGYSNYQNFE